MDAGSADVKLFSLTPLFHRDARRGCARKNCME